MSGSRKRRLIAGVAAVSALALTATACSSSKSSGGKVTTSTVGLNNMNTGTPKKGGSITVGIEKQITDWDQFDAQGATEDFVYLENGYWYGAPFIQEPDASVAINPDFVTSAQITSTSPQTITYQINPKAVWNDGTPITANDFKLTWLYQAGVDPLVSAASTSGYQDIASVVGSGANNQTVTVTWKSGKVDPDWKALFQVFPAHLAAQHGYDPNLTIEKLTTESANGKTGDSGLEASFKWFDSTVPTWSDGAYVVQSAASDGSKVVEVPNPKFYGAKGPYFDKVTFTAITDSAQEVPALKNGEVNVILPQPNQDIVKGVQGISSSKVKYQLDAGLQYEHVDLNMKNTFFGGATQADQQNPVKLALRQALFTVINRQAIIARTAGLVDSKAKPLNSRMFVPSQSYYTDNVSSTGQGSGDLQKAKQILQSAGYTNIGQGQHLTTPSGQQVPAFVMRYTSTNSQRATESQLVASEAAQLGITINVEGTDSLDKTLNQVDANHAYDIVVFAWVDTAFWATGNPPLFESNPPSGTVVGGNYGFYTNSQVDSLLQQAAQSLDLNKAASLENQADKLISADAYTLPLFQKDSMIAFDAKLVNVRDNVTSTGQSYNINEWGFGQ